MWLCGKGGTLWRVTSSVVEEDTPAAAFQAFGLKAVSLQFQFCVMYVSIVL